MLKCYGMLSSPPGFSGIRVTRSLVLCVYFVDRCLSFCTFSFGHCVVCSSIYGFWLPLFGIIKLSLTYIRWEQATIWWVFNLFVVKPRWKRQYTRGHLFYMFLTSDLSEIANATSRFKSTRLVFCHDRKSTHIVIGQLLWR